MGKDERKCEGSGDGSGNRRLDKQAEVGRSNQMRWMDDDIVVAKKGSTIEKQDVMSGN